MPLSYESHERAFLTRRFPRKGTRHMLSDEHIVLERIREFERTFEQHYQRKMTDEEERILHAAEQIIRQKVAGQSRNAA